MNRLEISRFPELDYACGEAMNTLCTNLSYCGDDVRVVLFTSRYEQEGKSSIVMNVMRTLAGLGKRVALVDADLRRSSLARRYRFSFRSSRMPGSRSISPGCARSSRPSTRRISPTRTWCPRGARCSARCSCWPRRALEG